MDQILFEQDRRAKNITLMKEALTSKSHNKKMSFPAANKSPAAESTMRAQTTQAPTLSNTVRNGRDLGFSDRWEPTERLLSAGHTSEYETKRNEQHESLHNYMKVLQIPRPKLKHEEKK